MAGAAKFASDEIKASIAEHVTSILAGEEGPTGELEKVKEQFPRDIPTEAWGMWSSDGALIAAWSADKMNAWYFHSDLTEAPGYSEQSYPAQSNAGDVINLETGEYGQMAAFIAGESPFFYINGERFTSFDSTDPEVNTARIAMCSGSNGRGAYVVLHKEKLGIQIFVYSSQSVVATDARVGIEPTLPIPSVEPIDGMKLKDLLAPFSGNHDIFWILG